MAAVQCDNFVGNAWKKDLCLNCFKSKEEHVMRNGFSAPLVTRIPDPPKEGILKGKKSASTPKGNKVNFLNKEYEVIGFGGDDVYSEDEDFPDLANNRHAPEDDEEAESEEERAFQKLTKSNTDYNSIPENLQEPKEGEVKKIIEPLKLGKQVFDDRGNKKTLLVSVTPFGDQGTIKNKINLNGFKMNGHQPEPEERKDFGSGKEKTETMTDGGGKVPGEVIKCANGKMAGMNGNVSKTDRQNEEDPPGKLSNEKSLKRSQPLDKNFKLKLNKTGETEGKEETNGAGDVISTSEKVSSPIAKAKRKVDQFPVISEKQNSKSKLGDLSSPGKNNRAVILDMYRIGEKDDTKTKNGINEEKTIKSVLLPSEIRNKFNSPEVRTPSRDAPTEKPEKPTNGFETDQNNSERQPEVVQNGCIKNHKLIPNVSSLHRNHFKNSKREEQDPLEPLRNGFPENNWPENKGKSSATEAPEGKTPDSSTKDEKQPEVLEPEENFKKTPFENFERIIQGEEITLFSAEKRLRDGQTKEESAPVPEISRESAGEPDGRADSDEATEPPALPSKPPPIVPEPRTTFLQDFTPGTDGTKPSEKPKVPVKPLIIQSKKINLQSPVHTMRAKSPSLEKFLDLPLASSPPATPKQHPPLQESLSSDSSKGQKRQAPKPPSPKEGSCEGYPPLSPEPESDDSGPPETAARDSVKRICRSTENLLELIADQEQKVQLIAEGLEEIVAPEPVPRRSLSLSQDSLVNGDAADVHLKKKLNRGKFLLRKILHLGKPKESTKDFAPRHKASLPTNHSKPKIEIIHPSDLTGSRVEVVPPARTSKSRRTSSSASSSSGEQRESDVLSDSSTSHSVSSSGNDSQTTIDRAKKPPPPPRANSSDGWTAKPARPPPPKSIDILRQVNSSWCASAEGRLDNHYVNLGEARSGLAPNKPIRTGSLREINPEAPKRLTTVTTQPEDSDYESFIVTPGQYSTPSHDSGDNLYECVQAPAHRSSLPECDSTLTDSPTSTYTKEKRAGAARNMIQRRSEGSVDVSPDYFKLKFLRSSSLPYCSSETESEIYSPYSFCGSEVGEDDHDGSTSSQSLRMSRLKMKKGRSIVHKNLEDNYGAVIVANHEALAQVVEQMRQGPSPPGVLRGLCTAVNLRWSDFTVAKDGAGVVVGRRVFYPALWGVHPVTLSVTAEQGLNSSFHLKGPFNLNPLTELNDLVPGEYLPMLRKDGSELVQASISVLTRLQIETIDTYGTHMRTNAPPEDSKKEVNFVLLQIINAFKTLQAHGIEEAPHDMSNLVVCREDRDPHPRVCITHSFDRASQGSPKASLCQCVARAVREILPPTELTPLISAVLLREKAVSLSRAKCILEFSLWGPADIAFGSSERERESALQRWLDLERATVLHGLVRTRAELTVFEEWQLLFLVRTNAKMMAEASVLLESGEEGVVSI